MSIYKDTGFAGMSKPFQEWPMTEITPQHWAAGKAHLAGANQKYLRNFGNQALGFAAEHAVADWFWEQGIEHNHNPDPRNTKPDFTINGLTIDLKSRWSRVRPKPDYDGDLADEQRIKDQKKGTPDWYLFGFWNASTAGDYHIMGFQTLDVILDQGVFYVEGEMMRGGVPASADCWCLYYKQMIKPLEWLEETF